MYSRRICAPDSFGGRPGTGRAFSASRPPSRYLASHPYTVPRAMPSDAATSSGCTPDSTASTARNRICSRVLVVQLAAVVIAHAAFCQELKIKSAY